MTDEIVPDNLPLIRLRDGAVFVEPPDYVPDIRETSGGPPVDLARVRWIGALIIEEHEDSDRLKRLAATRPEWHVEAGELRGEVLLAFRLGGEVIGLFEPELLDVVNGRAAMDRGEAARLVDRALKMDDRSQEDGRCGSCEAVIEEREVPVEEVPDATLAAYVGTRPDVWMKWEIQHGPGCPVTAFEEIAPEIDREHGFKLALVPRFKEMPDGQVRSWVRLVRVPEPGDPPVLA
jgi:hypothetical protein